MHGSGIPGKGLRHLNSKIQGPENCPGNLDKKAATGDVQTPEDVVVESNPKLFWRRLRITLKLNY
jgi:hypothetical protein